MPYKYQWEKMLELFQARKTWSNYELLDLTPRIVNIPKKIFELRAKGYNILTEHDLADRRRIYYTLVTA